MSKSIRIFLLSLFISPLAFSQELTSDISGVVSSGGDAVGGATVEITHVPTNSICNKSYSR